ncbi:MAG: DUF5723 family protein [Bacteroidia bacterium]
MKCKHVLLLLLFSICNMLKAQFNNDFLYYIKYGNSINLHAEYELNSTAVQNDLADKFIYGGNIDSSTKARSQKRLKAQNRIGGTYNAGATVFFGSDKSKYHFVAGLKQVEIANASFSRDAFNLAMYGNKMYEGKTADISNTKINNYQYQEVKLGLMWDNIDSTAKFGVSLSYLKGQTFDQLRTGAASIYTAPDASQINIAMNGSLAMSDTAKGKNNLTAFNGNGMAAELFAYIPYTSKLGSSSFFASVNNLGFIKWNKNSVNYSTDTTYIYKGVTANNIFQLNNASVQSLSKDSLVKKLTKNGKGPASSHLPMSVFILHTIKFSQLFTLNTALRYLFDANYKPYFYAEGQFAVHKNFSATVHVGIGGYGKLSEGLNMEYKVKTFYIRLGSNAMQGYIMPKHSLGQGVFISLTKKI